MLKGGNESEMLKTDEFGEIADEDSSASVAWR
jgi:hypothetical protein